MEESPIPKDSKSNLAVVDEDDDDLASLTNNKKGSSASSNLDHLKTLRKLLIILSMQDLVPRIT